MNGVKSLRVWTLLMSGQRSQDMETMVWNC